MIRFNYLDDARHRSFNLTFAIDNRIRGPLFALVAIVLVTVALTMVQLVRLRAAHEAYLMTSARLADGTAAVAQIKSLQARIDGKVQLTARVAEIRESSMSKTTELAWIGNHLPRDTWLRTLRLEHGTYSLEGTSTHVASVSGAMMALNDSSQTVVPRLISVHTDVSDPSAPVTYALRLDPRP
jgi:Tfp pilus assembly protein PilN